GRDRSFGAFAGALFCRRFLRLGLSVALVMRPLSVCPVTERPPSERKAAIFGKVYPFSCAARMVGKRRRTASAFVTSSGSCAGLQGAREVLDERHRYAGPRWGSALGCLRASSFGRFAVHRSTSSSARDRGSRPPADAPAFDRRRSPLFDRRRR